jgi:hypothetical protein
VPTELRSCPLAGGRGTITRMEQRNSRLAFVLFSLLWAAWLVARGFLSDHAEMAVLFALGSSLVVTVGVFAFRQTRRDAAAPKDESTKH